MGAPKGVRGRTRKLSYVMITLPIVRATKSAFFQDGFDFRSFLEVFGLSVGFDGFLVNGRGVGDDACEHEGEKDGNVGETHGPLLVVWAGF